jgi:ethanolamine transporter
MLNSAFAVSAAFVFAGHLAFTLSFNSDFVLGMILGKLVAGVCAVVVAVFLYNMTMRKQKNVSVEGA